MEDMEDMEDTEDTEVLYKYTYKFPAFLCVPLCPLWFKKKRLLPTHHKIHNHANLRLVSITLNPIMVELLAH